FSPVLLAAGVGEPVGGHAGAHPGVEGVAGAVGGVDVAVSADRQAAADAPVRLLVEGAHGAQRRGRRARSGVGADDADADAGGVVAGGVGSLHGPAAPFVGGAVAGDEEVVADVHPSPGAHVEVLDGADALRGRPCGVVDHDLGAARPGDVGAGARGPCPPPGAADDGDQGSSLGERDDEGDDAADDGHHDGDDRDGVSAHRLEVIGGDADGDPLVEVADAGLVVVLAGQCHIQAGAYLHEQVACFAVGLGHGVATPSSMASFSWQWTTFFAELALCRTRTATGVSGWTNRAWCLARNWPPEFGASCSVQVVSGPPARFSGSRMYWSRTSV